MTSIGLRATMLAALTTVAVACGSAAPPSPAPRGATSHDEFVAAACAAFDELDAAIGNPDAGSGSTLSKALDSAVAAGDVATANGLADETVARLEAGRRHLAIAGGWGPGRAMSIAADRFFLVAEALALGKKAGAATRDARAGQVAFEKAGGLEAWQSMISAAGAIQLPEGTSPKRCPNVAVQL
jgi:hypothetical protein